MTKRKRSSGNENQAPSNKVKYQLLTDGQKEFWAAMDEYEILFCDGVFGTGKTYLSACKALDLLLRKEIERIIVCRPTVTTSKRGVGFLPGDIKEKLRLYMLPVVEEMIKVLDEASEPGRGIELYRNFEERGQIKVEPLDYIRGRNFHNSFMILDESENADKKQINAFVSRIGKNSRVVVCGDSEQTDLTTRKFVYHEKADRYVWDDVYSCDFADMWEDIYVANHPDIGACELLEEDIVRSGILREYYKILDKR